MADDVRYSEPGTGRLFRATEDASQRLHQHSVGEGKSGGDFWPNPYYQRLYTGPNDLGDLRQDSEGNLAVRGAVTTDEGSFRDDFAGSGLTTSVGTISVTNGSTSVTGTNFITNGVIRFGHYIKIDSHAESALARVVRVLSETELELETAYSGATTSAAGSVQNYGQATGTGGSFSVATSAVTIASGTTIAAATYLYRLADYQPLIGVWVASVSQRIANQEAFVGFKSALTSPPMQAGFVFDGTTNTQVKLRSSFSTAAADIQETTVTLPGGVNSASSHRYKIECRPDRIDFYVNDEWVGTHRLHMPEPYAVLYQWAGWINGGSAPGSSSNLVVDVIHLNNTDQVNTFNFSDAHPVQGDVPHGEADRRAPVKVGMQAVAHGANPAAVDAGDRTNWYANRHGIPFVMGGHPNVISLELAITGSSTDVAVITVGAGTKIVVTQIQVLAANGNTAFPQLRVGFGAANTPTTTGVVLTHPAVPAGGGVSRGDGSGILGIGGDGEDLRVTNDAPTGGSLRLLVSYYTIES